MEAAGGALDLDEMDAEQREDLEAMLYAQVHHSSPDVAEMGAITLENGSQSLFCSRMCEMRQTKTLGVMEEADSENGNKIANLNENATKKLQTMPQTSNDASNAGVDMNCQTLTKRGSDIEAGSGVFRLVNDPNLGVHSSGSNSNLSLSGEAGATISKAAADWSTEPAAGGEPESAQPAGLIADEPETKTAALRRRPSPLSATITIQSSDSADSDHDQLVIDQVQAPCSERATPSVVRVRGMRKPLPAARDAGQLGPAARDAGRSACSSPEVVELAPAVSPVSAGSQTSSSEMYASSTCSAPTALGRDVCAARRARSVGPVLPPARLPRRLRTSSDPSSSESDVEPAQLSCDIQVNVLGASSGLAAGSPRQQVGEETTAGTDRSSLPGPRHRRVQRRLRLEKTPLLESLGRAAACGKWSRRQRRAYSTPRQHRVSSLEAFLDTLPDDGWQIPALFLPGAFASKQARARYYSALQRGRCRRCDSEGHVQSSCPLPPVCHLCGSAGHASALRCPSMFCYLCGAEDHLESRCPRHVRPVFCALCKAKGHTSDMCPDLWRRYHTTTTASVAPVAPPGGLDLKKRSRQHCWQCGSSGHPGHQCQGDRYTGLASMSQQLISYSATVCASSSVSGLVATPAQMDAVFNSNTRQSIERDSGAALSYEELGHGSWLINISGELEAARGAHRLVVQVMNGGEVGARPRPQSAPCSPSRERELPAANSKRITERKKRKADGVEEATVDGCVQVRPSAGASAGDDSSSDVLVVDEVVASSSGPKPKKSRLQRVELVTVISDEEEEGGGLSDEPQVVPAGPQSGVAAARVWKLNRLEANPPFPTDEQSTRSSVHRQLKRMRKEMLEQLKRSAGVLKGLPADGVTSSCSGSDAPAMATSSDTEPAHPVTAPPYTNHTCKPAKKRKGKGGGAAVSVVEANHSENGCVAGASDEAEHVPAKKQRKEEKIARLVASSECQQPSELPTDGTAAQPAKANKRKKRGAPPQVRCYMTNKLKKLVAAEGTDSPAVRKLKRLLKRQQKKALKAQEVAGSRHQTER